MRDEVRDAIDLKDVGKELNGGFQLAPNQCKAICKTCTRSFTYPKRRGRPPGACPACLEEFTEVKVERKERREKRQIQREEKSRDLAYDYLYPERYKEEREKDARERYERFCERVKDLKVMPSWEEYSKGYGDG